jgi:hypothetical protein
VETDSRNGGIGFVDWRMEDLEQRYDDWTLHQWNIRFARMRTIALNASGGRIVGTRLAYNEYCAWRGSILLASVEGGSDSEEKPYCLVCACLEDLHRLQGPHQARYPRIHFLRRV